VRVSGLTPPFGHPSPQVERAKDGDECFWAPGEFSLEASYW